MSKTHDTRDKLLQVAFDLIWNQSYGAVGVDQICERAKVNKGSFYHYFPSKADLTIAAYEEHWRTRQPELDQIFSPQVPPLERLERWCASIRERQKNKAAIYGRVCGCPYASLGTELATQDERIRAKSQEIVGRIVRYVESALIDAKRLNLIEIEDPKVVALRIYSAALGILLHARISNDLGLLADLDAMIMGMVGVKLAAALKQ